MSLAWGLGEVVGYRQSLETNPRNARWFYVVYVLAVSTSAQVVWLTPDLLWLNVAAQVVSALQLPLALGTLVALAVTALPQELRPRGSYLWALIAMWGVVSLAAVIGAVCYFVV